MFKSIKDKIEEEKNRREEENAAYERRMNEQRNEQRIQRERKMQKIREETKMLKRYSTGLRSADVSNDYGTDHIVSVNQVPKIVIPLFRKSDIWGPINYDALGSIKHQQDILIDQVSNLEDQNQTLLHQTHQMMQQIQELKNLIMYMPPREDGGIEFQNAKKDFESKTQ